MTKYKTIVPQHLYFSILFHLCSSGFLLIISGVFCLRQDFILTVVVCSLIHGPGRLRADIANVSSRTWFEYFSFWNRIFSCNLDWSRICFVSEDDLELMFSSFYFQSTEITDTFHHYWLWIFVFVFVFFFWQNQNYSVVALNLVEKFKNKASFCVHGSVNKT